MKTFFQLLTIISCLSANAYAGRESGGPMTLKVKCQGQDSVLGTVIVSVSSNYNGDQDSFELSSQGISVNPMAELFNGSVQESSKPNQINLIGNNFAVYLPVSNPKIGLVVFKLDNTTKVITLDCSYNQLVGN